MYRRLISVRNQALLTLTKPLAVLVGFSATGAMGALTIATTAMVESAWRAPGHR